MKRQITVKTLAATLLMSGLGIVWAADSSKSAEQPTYAVNQTITIQEVGKSTRKCTIVSATKQPDGSTAYTLKAADTGELITIHDKLTLKGTKTETTKVETVKAPAATPPATVKSDTKVEAKVKAKLVSTVKAPEPVKATETVKASDTPAMLPPKAIEAIPLAKERSVDPLLQLPGEARKDAKAEPIIANVNEASKSRPPIVKAEVPAKESRGIFGWLTGSKPTPAKSVPMTMPATDVPAVTTVSSAMTAKPVMVETSPVKAPTVGAKSMSVSLSPYGGSTGRASVKETGAPGLASVGEPLMQGNSRSIPVSMPVMMPQAPAMMPQAPVMMQPTMPMAPNMPVSQAPSLLPRDVVLQKTLKEALQPSEREIAAVQLTDTSNARTPAVKGALMTAAKEDPAATVRAACLRCLVKIAPGESSVMRTLEFAKEDRDTRVRNEANELLGAMKK